MIRTCLGLVGPVIFVSSLGLGGWLLAQPAAPAKVESKYMSDADLGVSCGQCHREPGPDARKPPRSSDKFILLREYVYWDQHDLHRRAFDALTSPLGQQMSKYLYDDPKAATKAVACLVCHATDSAPTTPLAEKTAAQFSYELGVNCQACHGPSTPWLAEHFKLSWRDRPAAEKFKDFHLTDLRDPAVRAKTCAGCHVGNANEGKFVTHEMYAAGHPPLPAFELATFSRDEPRHWRSPGEIEAIRSLKADDAEKRFHYRAGEVEAARLVAAGAVACFRETAGLLNFAADPKKADEPFDFAQFNCAACHHDLRVGKDGSSDRQKNGYPGVPGRPVPRTWPVWLLRIVLAHAATTDPEAAKLAAEFEAKLKAYREAFDAKPFGDVARVRAAANDLTATCDAIQKRIDAKPFTEERAWSLLATIAERAVADTAPPDAKSGARRDFLDADAAAQLARAFVAIYSELVGEPYAPGTPPAGPPSVEKLKSDPKGLADALKKLAGAVPLAIRDKYVNGRNDDGLTADHEKSLIQSVLGERLKTTYAYDPAKFREAFLEIQAKLAK